jgi:hypothetical protein
MNFTLLLHKTAEFHSVVWKESVALPGARYAIRRTSVSQRIALAQKARELAASYEFLKAGDADDQLQASLSDLLVRRLYLEWGVVEVKGLRIDGQPATVSMVIENGPEALSDEMLAELKSQLFLTDEERKNF